MSNYHILTQALDKKTAQVVFHFPIPTGNNAVAVPWRTALLNWQGGADAVVSQLPGISQAELDAMKAGALFEKAIPVRFSSLALEDSQRLAQIQAAFTDEKDAFLAEMAIQLNFYGLGGDV